MKQKWIIAVVVVLAVALGWSLMRSNETTTQPGTAASTADAPEINWRLASVWADGTFLYDVDKRFCDLVSEMSDGKFNIKPFGVGALAPANQVFDIVSNGTVEAGGDWPSYWTGKSTGFDPLATVMYQFTGWDYYLWIYTMNGLDAYNKMFGKFGMVYFPTAITQMESGIRSKKPINKLEDMKGMKIRFAGKIQGMVIQKFGVTPVTIAANELYEALQRGVIDAAEYSGPHNDDVMKIQEVAKYWLAPGWHQTASVYGVLINQKAYDALPDKYKTIIDHAARLTGHEYMAKYAHNDAVATQKMMKEGITITHLPQADMDKIEVAINEAMEQLIAENPDYEEVIKSQLDYMKFMEPYRTALGEFGFGKNKKFFPKNLKLDY